MCPGGRVGGTTRRDYGPSVQETSAQAGGQDMTLFSPNQKRWRVSGCLTLAKMSGWTWEHRITIVPGSLTASRAPCHSTQDNNDGERSG
jgi:hypothetical protein